MTNQKISTHISILVTSIISVCFIFFVFIVILFKQNDFKVQNEQDIQANLNFISTSISEPLYTFNKNSMKNILKSFVNIWDHSMSAIRILDIDGKVILTSTSSTEGKLTFPEIADRDKTKLRENNILYENRIIGKIQIVTNDEVFKSELKKWITNLISYSLIVLIILFGIFYFAFQNLLGKPLNKLVTEISKLRKNDFSAKVEGTFKFELEKIALDFNKAIEGIKIRDTRINEYAFSLEEMVEKRTKERDDQTLKALNSARLASIGEVSAGIAHEINNPLAVISIISNQMAKKFELRKSEFEDEIEKISKIKKMVLRIQKIIDSLRRISRDGSKEEFAKFELNDFIESLKDLINYKMLNSDIEFNIHNKSNLTFLIGQEIQLSQVLINLLNNAADAISKNDQKWINLEITEDEKYVYFSVIDSGLGIPEEVVEKMLNPFFTTKEKGKGTGLGLSISRNIINEHGGELNYDKSSKNTKFTFNILKKD